MSRSSDPPSFPVPAESVAAGAWSALLGVSEAWRLMSASQDIWAAVRSTRAAIERRRDERLQSLLAHARQHSRLYRERIGPSATSLDAIEPVSRSLLMSRFDDWVCDPAITRSGVEAFVADLSQVGAPFLGRYCVWTSSGSTGVPGIYVQDPEALAVYSALLTLRGGGGLRQPTPWSTIAAGSRMAMLAATGGHFAGVASWERIRRMHPWMAPRAQVFSVLQPLTDLVAQLNTFQPMVIATYPTTLQLLAEEHRAGRLVATPTALWSGGESLPAADKAAIGAEFGCRVIDDYGASEMMSIGVECEDGHMHVNEDWVVLEPVDAQGRPAPAGEFSATVLLTNLANRVQPLIRYDLGDSVRLIDEPCTCGSPLRRMQVSGRRDDIVALRTDDDRTTHLLPLALSTVLEEGAGVHRFQITQTDGATLSTRFEPPAGVDRDTCWRRIEHCLRQYLAEQHVTRVTLVPDPTPPKSDPVSGKLRQVIVSARAQAPAAARPSKPAQATRQRSRRPRT